MPHERSADTDSAGSWVDDHLRDLAPMRLVGRHGGDELDRAEKVAIVLRAEQDPLSRANFGLDVT